LLRFFLGLHAVSLCQVLAATLPAIVNSALLYHYFFAPQFDIQVFIKIAGKRIVIPISVRDIQFKCNARCILHMVDVMPCIGGATVSMLSVPHVDFK
jgi:hypothetical protein